VKIVILNSAINSIDIRRSIKQATHHLDYYLIFTSIFLWKGDFQENLNDMVILGVRKMESQLRPKGMLFLLCSYEGMTKFIRTIQDLRRVLNIQLDLTK
jgi:hypothetical protein